MKSLLKCEILVKANSTVWLPTVEIIWFLAQINLFNLCWWDKNAFLLVILAFKTNPRNLRKNQSLHWTSHWLTPVPLHNIFFCLLCTAHHLNSSIILCYYELFIIFNSLVWSSLLSPQKFRNEIFGYISTNLTYNF